ncbi:Hypothetical predicted protein [Paramuricea clavata]|uniref:Uncharacterized protein n=1 Tax=Paramuricea clavata TaxID=317549 RepID=A0A6S7KA77_PARCT|nr:Hypothetical predicted protein [Paramuricea clavata]
MTSSVFAVLFGLNFVLFPCEGQVSPPSSGDTFVVLPGEDVTITWTLHVGAPNIGF